MLISVTLVASQKTQGRRREDVQFIEAKVDASLGNIRENIRKGANQKHISTSMVDPLKQMKKSGKFSQKYFTVWSSFWSYNDMTHII